MPKLLNPVMPGFFPDPSVVRVGNNYYSVHSSFEYFPGVPLLHSRDLTHWRHIGNVLTRRSQLPLEQAGSSRGIFAPTLRYHAGTFYMITTNMSAGKNFYVTAKAPEGPWSEPSWLDEPEPGMDPSLFFDHDGKVYYTRHGGGEHGAAFQAEIDISQGRLNSPLRQIWTGTGGRWPEGPHLYRRGEYYYLLQAEGGTSYEHRVVVARSTSPWGPFEACPHGPLLTHQALPEHPIQALGHADLVEAPDGNWWAVLLGIRPVDGAHHHLGREMFLSPVTWGADNWPQLNNGQALELEQEVHTLPPPSPWPVLPVRDDFEQSTLSPHWLFIRNPEPSMFEVGHGRLTLKAATSDLESVGSPAFVGRRQQHFECVVRCSLDFSPRTTEQEAGLAVRANEDNQYRLCVTCVSGKRRVQLKQRLQGATTIVGEVSASPGPLVLSILASKTEYAFELTATDGAPQVLGHTSTIALSSEQAGGFTGVVIGMYASGAGSAHDPQGSKTRGADTQCPPAHFEWFEYDPQARSRTPRTGQSRS